MPCGAAELLFMGKEAVVNLLPFMMIIVKADLIQSTQPGDVGGVSWGVDLQALAFPSGILSAPSM